MAINPAIAMGVRGIELQDPLAQYGRVAAIQSAQQQNQLAQLQMQQAQRAQESTNAFNRAYAAAYNPATGDIDINKLRQSAISSGFASMLPDAEKKLGEVQSQRLTQEELRGRIATNQVNLVDSKLKQARSFLDTIDPADPAAPQRYIAWQQANYNDPVLGPVLKNRGVSEEDFRSQVAQAVQQGPQAFAALLNRSKLGTEKFIELNKPTTQVVDRSGTKVVLQSPGLGGAPVTVGTYSDVPLPADVEAQKARIAAAGRAPAQPVAPTVVTVEDPTAPGKFLQVDARTYRGGGAGSPGVIGGARPSAATEKANRQQAQLGKDLDFAIRELANITADGGLIDQSTGSGAGRLVDVGARFLGKAMPGDIAIGKIAPVADLALKMVPRFEGPQSNADTASYKEAAGQLADATLPTEVRKQAGQTVLRLMRERKNQFVSADMAAEGAAPGGAGGVDTSNPLLK
jgi:hypothetical protein